MKKVIIIGGGIAGISLAYYLQKKKRNRQNFYFGKR